MEIKINALEVTSVLTISQIADMVKRDKGLIHPKDFEAEVFTQDGNTEVQIFREEYQDIFNDLYDFYFEILTNSQIH